VASLVDDLFSDGAIDQLLEKLGESVTQYPRGVVANAVALTAIVDLGSEGQALPDDLHGSQRVRWLRLTMPASVSVAISERPQERDQFLVRGLIWHAEAIPQENAGLQTVLCKRTEGASTLRTRA